MSADAYLATHNASLGLLCLLPPSLSSLSSPFGDESAGGVFHGVMGVGGGGWGWIRVGETGLSVRELHARLQPETKKGLERRPQGTG